MEPVSFDTKGRQYAPLYSGSYEHDACGVGLVADIKGRASREIVERALGGLVNLTHRGGVGADERTGDGAGVLTQVPHGVFAPILASLGRSELRAGDYAVAMVFLPRNAYDEGRARERFRTAIIEQGLDVIGWRTVPT